MATEKKQQEGAVAAATTEPSVARRLWRVVRAVLFMLRRGLPSGRKLAMDLHLLLHRGKIIAGKALGDRFLASHHGHGHAFSYASGARASAAGGPFSCGALDPSLAVHEPSRRRREVEFSCSNTPSSASGGGALGLLGAAARRRRRRRSSRQQQQQYRDEAEASNGYLMQYYYDYDAAEVARVFEMLSDEEDGDDRRLFSDNAVPVPGASSLTPSPAQVHLLRLPAAAGSSRPGQQQQASRIAAGSSPADGGAAQVDRRADEFIRRFYEQLRAQRSAASTPDYYGYAGASPYGAARAPRPVTASIS
ncbi:unnamed protein product [Miscanthus lutarioriparius]|uniref:Uncharacterized protein n=1 Tax=Miscanthus lutarioriparius TaxID=422564 RepID=A0A811PSD5_9POAL|nr:unnamed protein product [Miscanthus lutarioriparius]